VRRELDWAQVVNGRRRAVDFAAAAAGDVSTAPHLELGRAAEAAAARHVERLGYRILTTNFRAKGGELDLVAVDGAALAIIEVRYRASDRFGGAAASITQGKRRRIISAGARPARDESARSPGCRHGSTFVEVTAAATIDSNATDPRALQPLALVASERGGGVSRANS
jgi:putative endonuclease